MMIITDKAHSQLNKLLLIFFVSLMTRTLQIKHCLHMESNAMDVTHICCLQSLSQNRKTGVSNSDQMAVLQIRDNKNGGLLELLKCLISSPILSCWTLEDYTMH